MENNNWKFTIRPPTSLTNSESLFFFHVMKGKITFPKGIPRKDNMERLMIFTVAISATRESFTFTNFSLRVSGSTSNSLASAVSVYPLGTFSELSNR